MSTYAPTDDSCLGKGVQWLLLCFKTAWEPCCEPPHGNSPEKEENKLQKVSTTTTLENYGLKAGMNGKGTHEAALIPKSIYGITLRKNINCVTKEFHGFRMGWKMGNCN